MSNEYPVAEEKVYAKGQENFDTNLGKRSAYADAVVERKTTGKIGGCESSKLSPLASRLDTNF